MFFFMAFYRWFYLKSHFDTSELLFSDIDFLIVILSIVLGAGSGFLINDLYDVHLDQENHSKNKLKDVSSRIIWLIYAIMNVVCGIACIALIYKYNITRYFILYPLSTFLLWFYSYKLKKQFLIGNLTISALIAGLVIFIFPFIELEHLNKANTYHFTHVLFLTSLAFLLNLAREIIKDIEDRKGDRKYGCKTLPIALGVNRTKQIVVFIFGTTAFTFLLFLGMLSVSLSKTIIFYSLFLMLVSALICLVKFAKTNTHFHQASVLLKIVMLFGIISVILWI